MRAALALLLLALPVHAEAIRVGARADRAIHLVPQSRAASVTIDALPYTRTVTASSYTLTGTYFNFAPATWYASPSGSSGACSDLGAGSFSCVVTVTPDATGEGVETIAIGNGSVTLGFYVAGAHTAFLSQNVNGSYNTGIADNDAVATWENVGTSALDVTQGVGTAQPKVKLNIVGGQPVVRCDGGDRLVAAAAAAWIFMHDGTGQTTEALFLATALSLQAIAATLTSGNPGVSNNVYDATGKSNLTVFGSGLEIINTISDKAPTYITANTFNLFSTPLASSLTPDVMLYINNAESKTTGVNPSGAYSSGNPGGALTICSTVPGSFGLTGDLFRILIYQSALDATQRGINKAVDEWALGGTLPVTP